MDDYTQEDAPDDYCPPVNIKGKRWRGGGKGDIAGQARRYYQRNKAKRKDYMRRYMRARRAIVA